MSMSKYEEDVPEEIAIIGMSCQLPKCENPSELWTHLKEGRELISHFSHEELIESGVPKKFFSRQGFVASKGYIDHIEDFDSHLFPINGREIKYMDPQQRLLFECTWHLFEDAGLDISQDHGLVGVFIGGNSSQYFLDHLNSSEEESSQDGMLKLVGNGSEYLATRLSYLFNFKGQSQTVQTACSSSLVAIHHAWRSLLNYECDLAVTGGVSVMLPKKNGYFYSKDGIYSPDGHCRPFDKESQGTVFSDGAGLVLLKRKSDAIRDGDRVYATIKGSFVNNDGLNKVNFFAPSSIGQAEVIAQALANSKINPETISYVEAHGTGTAIGDAIELQALNEAFSLFTEKKHFCAIGSIKSNLGHLNASAGVAALIKAVLIAKEGYVPATLHFKQLNKKHQLTESPFFIPIDGNYPLPKQDHGARVGVSSFGIGGTNAHIIIENNQEQSAEQSFSEIDAIIPISSSSLTSLKQMKTNLLEFIQKNRPNLHDIAYTLQVGRKSLQYRKVFFVNNLDDLISHLQEEDEQDSIIDGVDPQLASWLRGELDRINLYKESRPKKISLPLYPFDRKRYWVEKKGKSNIDEISDDKQKNEIDSILVIFWKKVLGEKDLGEDPDFFELGGDSLKAIELLDLVKSLFAIELTLNDFFGALSLHKMGQLIKEKVEGRLMSISPTGE